MLISKFSKLVKLITKPNDNFLKQVIISQIIARNKMFTYSIVDNCSQFLFISCFIENRCELWKYYPTLEILEFCPNIVGPLFGHSPSYSNTLTHRPKQGLLYLSKLLLLSKHLFFAIFPFKTFISCNFSSIFQTLQ